MDWLARVAGAAIILFVLRDIFHTLVHPKGQGILSRLVFATMWQISQLRHGKGRLGRLSGPLALVTVILAWCVFAVVGWAIVYLPSVPDGFVYSSGSAGSTVNPVLDALYISTTAISTLGFGDIVPAPGWLRIATPLEALFGFALLTVAVSWILQIYPVLARRRVLAIQLFTLGQMRDAAELVDDDSSALSGILHQLSIGIIQARVDLNEYSETYYFRDDRNSSLAAMLPCAAQLAQMGAASSRPDTRTAASMLNRSLEQLAEVLHAHFPRVDSSLSNILAAYASDHGHAPSDP